MSELRYKTAYATFGLLMKRFKIKLVIKIAPQTDVCAMSVAESA